MGGRRQVRAVGRTRGGRGLARNPRNRGGLPPGRVDALAGWRSKDGDGNRRAGTHCLSSGTATPMLKRPLVRPADRCAARSECPTAGDFLLTPGASARICFHLFYASQDKYLATPALPSQSSSLSLPRRRSLPRGGPFLHLAFPHRSARAVLSVLLPERLAFHPRR